jgi:hypothetical protein
VDGWGTPGRGVAPPVAVDSRDRWAVFGARSEGPDAGQAPAARPGVSVRLMQPPRAVVADMTLPPAPPAWHQGVTLARTLVRVPPAGDASGWNNRGGRAPSCRQVPPRLLSMSARTPMT